MMLALKRNFHDKKANKTTCGEGSSLQFWTRKHVRAEYESRHINRRGRGCVDNSDDDNILKLQLAKSCSRCAAVREKVARRKANAARS